MAIDTAEFVSPRTLREALDIRAAGSHTVLAGGTDFYPARVGKPLTEPVLDITKIADLRGISRTDDGFRIGALTTWSDIMAADLPSGFDGLKKSAARVGGIQIQNVGTIAGNLCNASPAADGVPPLLTLDASVELSSVGATRVLPLSDFLVGYRETALRSDELVTAILVPSSLANASSEFLKLGARTYLVISIAMVAVAIAFDELGEAQRVRVAIGACSPVAQRAHQLEADLVGRRGDLGALVTREHLNILSPIDDVRAAATDRLDAALHMVQRAIRNCLQ